MKHLFPFLFVVFTMLALSACDKVETPIPAPVDTGPCPDCPEVDSAALNVETTKVLVEEFTGHTCAFCPSHTKKLLAMQEEEGEQIVAASIHAGETFAAVEDDYPEDFTTPFGDAIHEDYQIVNFGYPSALVLRATYPNLDNRTIFVGHTGGWEDAINERLNKPATIALGVAADYEQETSQFLIRISAKAVTNITGDHKLVVLCIEDSVVAPQKDNFSDLPHKLVPDYTHRHVVRAQVNSEAGVYGETFISSALLENEWLDKTYVFPKPANVLDPLNCSIIAFITNAETKEVIQVEEAHVHLAD